MILRELDCKHDQLQGRDHPAKSIKALIAARESKKIID